MKEIFTGIYKKGKNYYTKNLIPGKTVYSEKLIKQNNTEFREWDIRKSKLAAAIVKGIKEIDIKPNDTILYLGAASGTTVSHISDIVGKQGLIFGLDFAPRVVRDLVFVSEDRKNIAPILADANKPETYQSNVCQVDVIYMDIAQRDQVNIFLKNINIFLKDHGYCLLAIKARSIDVTKKPKDIYIAVRKQLEKHLKIIDSKTLDPFEKDHCFFVCQK